MRSFILFALVALCAASFLPLLGGRFWFTDLAANFRPQIVLCLALVLLLALIQRQWGQASVAVVAAAFSLYLTIDFPLAPRANAGSGEGLRVVSFNLLASERDIAPEIDWLLQSEADVVALYEVTPGYAAQLARLKSRFPHSLIEPHRSNFGMALFSRLPLIEVQTLHPAGPHFPLMRARIDVAGASVELFAAHPPPPITPGRTALRDLYFDAIAELPPTAGARLLLGDLNATPWTQSLRDLARSRGFAFAERWPRPTWPSGSFWPFALPIDHVLVAGNLAVADLQRGPQMASDHLPVVAVITVRK